EKCYCCDDYESPPDDPGTLEDAAGGGWIYTNKYGVQWTYDSLGYLQSITDPHNLTITFAYTTYQINGQIVKVLASVTEPDGGATTFDQQQSGSRVLITAIHEPGGRTLTLSQGTNLNGITDVD